MQQGSSYENHRRRTVATLDRAGVDKRLLYTRGVGGVVESFKGDYALFMRLRRQHAAAHCGAIVYEHRATAAIARLTAMLNAVTALISQKLKQRELLAYVESLIRAV